MDKILTLIPARKGSKGVPNKNFRPFLSGKSLVDLAVDCALSAKPTGGIVVSTDASQSELSIAPPVILMLLPPELANDRTPMYAVVEHVMEAFDEYDAVLLLQPTTPTRTVDMIRAAVLMAGSFHSSVVSVSPVPSSYHAYAQIDPMHPQDTDRKHIRRQDYPPSYVRDGAFYVFRREHKFMYGGNPLFVRSPTTMISIDTEEDWVAAQQLMVGDNNE